MHDTRFDIIDAYLQTDYIATSDKKNRNDAWQEQFLVAILPNEYIAI